MKITAETMLYVVGSGRHGGMSHLTLEGLVNAVKGGTKLEEVAIFTGMEEAAEHEKRVKLLGKGAYLLEGLPTEELERVVNAVESNPSPPIPRRETMSLPCESHGSSGRCVELDSVDGHWRESEIMTEKVAIVPFGGRGEFVAVVNLPYHVGRSSNWERIIEECCFKLSSDGCTSTPRKAYDFYMRVFNELTAWGY